MFTFCKSVQAIEVKNCWIFGINECNKWCDGEKIGGSVIAILDEFASEIVYCHRWCSKQLFVSGDSIHVPNSFFVSIGFCFVRKSLLFIFVFRFTKMLASLAHFNWQREDEHPSKFSDFRYSVLLQHCPLPHPRSFNTFGRYFSFVHLYSSSGWHWLDVGTCTKMLRVCWDVYVFVVHFPSVRSITDLKVY